MPEHNPGDMGGTMRLGKRRTVFKTQNSILSKLRLCSFTCLLYRVLKDFIKELQPEASSFLDVIHSDHVSVK